jgi:hypothetical protein
VLARKGKRSSSSAAPAGRRGGAALIIREECERFFCESVRTAFLGERNAGARGSGLMTGVSTTQRQNPQQLMTPPQDESLHLRAGGGMDSAGAGGGMGTVRPEIQAWLELWDYQGGAAFRGFVAENASERAMFVFIEKEQLKRDLKPS